MKTTGIMKLKYFSDEEKSSQNQDIIIITNRDISSILNIVQFSSDRLFNMHKSSSSLPPNSSIMSSIDPSQLGDLTEKNNYEIIPNLVKFATPFFVYRNKNAANIEILQYEFVRDDFYLMKFVVPLEFKEKNCMLKLMDLSSKNYNEIIFSNVSINEDKTINFDSVNLNIFNPRKKCHWVKKIEDLAGSLFKIEISMNKNENKPILVKYICFDYYSFENYVTALAEIAYYQKLQREKQKLKTNNNESEIINENEIIEPFKKLANNDENCIKNPGAFRHIMLRLKNLEGQDIAFFKKKIILSVMYFVKIWL